MLLHRRFTPLFVAALALIAAVAVAPRAQAQDVVRLGNMKFVHYGAIWYMKELAPKYHLKIEEQIFAKGLDIFPAIISGNIDAAATGVDAAISARGAGVPVYIVAGFARGGVRIVGRTDLGLKTVESLKGHTVGVTRGGAQEIALLAELAAHHLTWSDKGDKDVRLVYLSYPDLSQAIASKSLDAMCQSEPQASVAISMGIGTEISKPYDTPMGSPIRALSVTEKFYKEHPDVAARFLSCFVEATKLFLDHPEKAESYVREIVFKKQLSHDEYIAALGNSPFCYDITADHVQVTTDCMVRYGVGRMANPPVAADYVKTDLLAKAKAALGAQ